MIKLDLQTFGGRGGTSTSRGSINRFFEIAKRGAVNQGESDNRRHNLSGIWDIDAAQHIYSHIMDAKTEADVRPRGYYHTNDEMRILKEWTNTSKVAHFTNENDSDRFTVDRGKLPQARREYEQYVKRKFREYYKTGKKVLQNKK